MYFADLDIQKSRKSAGVKKIDSGALVLGCPRTRWLKISFDLELWRKAYRSEERGIIAIYILGYRILQTNSRNSGTSKQLRFRQRFIAYGTVPRDIALYVHSFWNRPLFHLPGLSSPPWFALHSCEGVNYLTYRKISLCRSLRPSIIECV